jgi:hypothetical protein
MVLPGCIKPVIRIPRDDSLTARPIVPGSDVRHVVLDGIQSRPITPVFSNRLAPAKTEPQSAGMIGKLLPRLIMRLAGAAGAGSASLRPGSNW